MIERALQRLRRIALAAWNTSRTAAILRRSDAQWRGFPTTLRIQVVALLVVCVSAGQIFSLWLLPPYAMSGLPKFWFVTAAALAGLVSVLAAPLASAWPESRTARGLGVVTGERRN